MMFSGIVESKARLLEYTPQNLETQSPTRIKIEKPSNFKDISIGDSIAVNGVCLTVEAIREHDLQFCLGSETLRVTNWTEPSLKKHHVNLERSLKWSDRIHGHLVSGHIDSIGQITYLHDDSGCRDLRVTMPGSLRPYFWRKGSITLNGVSLTVNDVQGRDSVEVAVTLIPETLARTNLSELQLGDQVTIEVDQLARGLVHMLNNRNSFFEGQNL